VSVLVEIAWFFAQGRLIRIFSMTRWLVVCGAATVARMVLTGGLGDWLLALFVAQALHALTFASHHTACIAMVSHHFPGRLRGRGQALFTVIGYGCGGVTGVLAGGTVVSWFGFEVMYGVATVLAGLATLCAWRTHTLEEARA
jgi:PPP family 3-phenylpropionic acid transporter